MKFARRLVEFLKETISQDIPQAVLIILLSQIVVFYAIFLRGDVVSSDVNLQYYPFSQYITEQYGFDTELRSDMIDSYYPVTQNFFEDVKSGNAFSWDNNQKLGIPTDVITKNHSPFQILNFFVSVESALTIEIMAKFFLGGLFMYLLLKEFKIGHIASLFGAIVFMYSGFNIVWFWNFASTASLCLPIILYSAIKVSDKKYKFIPTLLFGISYSLLAGFVAGFGYSAYFVGVFLIFKYGVKLFEQIKKIIKSKKKVRDNTDVLFNSLKPYLITALVFLIGISITAFTLVPTVRWLNRVNISYRMTSNASHSLDFAKFFPQLLMPYYNGGTLTLKLLRVAYFGASNFNESSGYIGMIPIMMVIVGGITAFIKKDKNILFMIVADLFFITVVYGIGPSLDLIKGLPIFNSSSSTRLLMLIAFTGSIIAAYGLSNLKFLISKIGELQKRTRLFIFGLLILVPLVVIVSVFFTKINLQTLISQGSLGAILSWMRESGYKYFLYHLLNFSVFYLTFVFVIFLIWAGRKVPKYIPLITYLIFLLSFTELSLYSLKQISNLPSPLHYPETQSVKFLRENSDELERVIKTDFAIGPSGTEVYFDLHNIYDHDFYTVQEREYLRKPMVEGRKDFLVTATYPSVHYDDLNYNSEVLDELNVKYIVFPPDISQKEIVDLPGLHENFTQVYYNDKELNIYENRSDYSLIHWESGEEMNAQTELLKDGYERFKVTNTHGLDKFYTSELYYDKWQVYVDGEKAELKSVHDGLFKAVELDKGTHIVEFIYESGKLYRYGFIYAAAMYIFILIFHLWTILKTIADKFVKFKTS